MGVAQSLIKESIREIERYQVGRGDEEGGVIKLSSNENPLGVSEKAKEAIAKFSGRIHRYPPDNPSPLRKEIAERFCLKAENIILGNGSDEIIDLVIKAFLMCEEEVLLSEIDFLLYRLSAKIAGAKIVSVPPKEFKTDLEAMKRKVNKRTKIIFLSNPNNPLGTYLNRREMEEFLRALPESVIVVVDQAYAEFVDKDDYPLLFDLLPKHNLILLRTFSKFYGLAGLRIGYGISNARLIEYLNRVRFPFNVNYLAQEAARAVLKDKVFANKTKETVECGRRYIFSRLDEMGVFYINTVTNFVSIDIREDGEEFSQKMLNYGIAVRDLKPYRLSRFVRVSIGQEKENRKFIEALKALIGGR
ncbi:MAG: histidinol-phosphate transaminase [Candidatus Omnitrophota bacterium]|nr:MAG: histidinol-phosphate transaminase [Candidatus Omnitrophota bacterium]